MSKPAIFKTLHYFDIFDYPLKVEEVHKYLVERLSVDALEKELTQMSADVKLISAGSGFYCLPGREEIIELRKKREGWSQPKLQKAKRIAGVLKFIPWIKLIGVTGALALENSDEGDDIDLVIITSPRRLWLTRGLVVTFLLLTGQYRRANKIKDRICPNLMLSEEALEFPDHDLFTAHEIVQMKPVFERENTYQKFLQANQWVEEFLPNAIESAKCKVQSAKFSSKLKTGNTLLNSLETLAYRLQLKVMESKRTVEVTTPNVIRFHPEDIRQKVLDEYQKRVYFRRKDGNRGLSVRGGRPNLPK